MSGSRRVVRTLLARADLDEIWDRVAEDNPEAARKLVQALMERCRLLAESPLIGRARPELGVRVRSFPHGRYLLLYRPLEDGIELLRVAGPGRDVDAMFD